MEHKKIFDFVGTVFLFIGMSLSFLPHAFHIKAGLDGEISHLKHVIYGIILVTIGLIVLIYNNKALRIKIDR